MASPPDEGIATMAGLLGDALRHLDAALSKLGTDGDHATASADAAIAAQRKLETAYYAGMVGLLGVEDRTERITRRELYRRSSRIGDAVVASPSASSTRSSSRAERGASSGSGCAASRLLEVSAAMPTS